MLTAAPANLIAAIVSPTQVNLSWADNSDDETGFQVQTATLADFSDAQSATVAANTTDYATYQETGLTAGTQYYFRVRALDSAGDSAFSGVASATPAAVSAPPADGAGGSSAAPVGAKVYKLDGGFVLDPYAAFTPAILGNYSSGDTSNTSASAVLDADPAAQSDLATTYGRTLTIVSTLAEDGSWTYSETLTAETDVAITQVVSGTGASGGASTSWDYTFTASGDASTSSFTFIGHWSFAARLNPTGSWSTSGSDTTQFTSSTDLSTGDVTITTASRVGSSTGTSSASGPYSYTFTGGSASGTATLTGGYDDSWDYTADGGTYTFGSDQHLSYNGTGTVSSTIGSNTVSGTITESGEQDWTYGLTLDSTRNSDSTWSQTGSDSAGYSDTGDWSYSGGGPYTITEDDASTLTGTLTLNYTQHATDTVSVGSTLGTDGQWRLASSSASGTEYDTDSSSFTVTLPYSDSTQDDSGATSISGTATATDTQGGSTDATWTAAIGDDGHWHLATGSATLVATLGENSTYKGSGSYTGASGGGTISDNGGQNFTAQRTIHSQVSAGDWVILDGTGTSSLDANDHVQYGGGGTFSQDDGNGGTIAGTTDARGGVDSGYHIESAEALGADGLWYTTSSSARSWERDNQGISYRMPDGRGGEDQSGWTTDITYSLDPAGNWIPTGTATYRDSGGTYNSWCDSSEYSRTVDQMSITGSTTTSGDLTTTYEVAATATLNADGTWSLTSGGATTGWKAEQSTGWGGSGSYSAPEDTQHDVSDTYDCRSADEFYCEASCTTTHREDHYEHTFGESYSEGGSLQQWAGGQTLWTLDPSSGAFTAVSTSAYDGGEASGGYNFSSTEEIKQSTVDQTTTTYDSGGSFSSSEQHGSDEIIRQTAGESYNYYYGRTVIDGTGSGSGGGTASGSAGYSDIRTQQDQWPDGSSSQSQSTNGSSDGYQYADTWGEDYANGQSTPIYQTAGGTASGQRDPFGDDPGGSYSYSTTAPGFNGSPFYNGPGVGMNPLAQGGPGLGSGQHAPEENWHDGTNWFCSSPADAAPVMPILAAVMPGGPPPPTDVAYPPRETAADVQARFQERIARINAKYQPQLMKYGVYGAGGGIIVGGVLKGVATARWGGPIGWAVGAGGGLALGGVNWYGWRQLMNEYQAELQSARDAFERSMRNSPF